MNKNVKIFIENNIHLIDGNKFDILFEVALIDAELNEEAFNELYEVLQESDMSVKQYRDELFIDLFSQYIEENEEDYEQGDADRLEEMMDTMSTAVCLGLNVSEIYALINQWSEQHPGRIQIEGSSKNELRIRFLIGNGESA